MIFVYTANVGLTDINTKHIMCFVIFVEFCLLDYYNLIQIFFDFFFKKALQNQILTLYLHSQSGNDSNLVK
ncbi:hypothetical protein DNC80_13040 [Flavobacterium sp. SOK18b]|nr:hypothetical protein [Flavobacterium sp. SOK18b]